MLHHEKDDERDKANSALKEENNKAEAPKSESLPPLSLPKVDTTNKSHIIDRLPSSQPASNSSVDMTDSDLEKPVTPGLEGGDDLSSPSSAQSVLSHNDSEPDSDKLVAEHKNETLQQIEQNVNSPHLKALNDNPEDTKNDAVHEARDTVASAGPNSPLQPIQALGAQPLGPSLHSDPGSPLNTILPPSDGPGKPLTSTTIDPSAPPPVPPPIIPPAVSMDEDQTII